MSEALCVKWTITANEHPQPLLHCRRCCSTQPFRTGGKMRVNANGKRIDAWLIYRCTACEGTWNRPVLGRRPVGSIEPEILSSLMANDAELVAQIASDAEDLRRHAPQLKETAEMRVTKSVLSGNASRPRTMHIMFAVPQPVALRLDRLLAEELGLSRSRIHALAKAGTLAVSKANTARALRKPVRGETELTIRLPVTGAEWIAHSAAACCGT